MIRRPPRSTRVRSSAASDVYKRQLAWRIVATGLSGGEWDRAVAEVYTLLILDGVSLNDDLVTRATVILGEWGWRVDEDTTDGRVPPDERSVSYAWHQTYWPL